MKRRASNLNFSSRVPNSRVNTRLVWNNELTPQEFSRQRVLNKPTKPFLSIVTLPLRLLFQPFRLVAAGSSLLLNSKARTLSLLLGALLVVTLFKLLPLLLNSNSELLGSLKPPKPLSLIEASSRLATLKPIAKAELIHTIKSGENLGSIARQYNLSIVEAAAINEAIETYRTKEKLAHLLKPGVELSIVVNSSGIKQLTIPLEVGKNLAIRKNKDGSFSSSLSEIARKRSQRVAIGLIESSFAEAARNSGLSYAMVDELVDLFGDRVAFHKDFRAGDRFSIIYSEEKLANGQILGNDEIIGASVEVNGQTLYAIRYVGSDKKVRFFDKTGEVLGNSFLRYPVKFSRISSLFSESRFHPIHKINLPHNGVDFAAATGTPVRSVANGTIVFAGRNGASGIMVKIQHDDRYSTAYLHLSKIESGVRNGARVTRGQVIGAVGMTGSATGPHLHYSFYDRGSYIDPLKIDLPTLNDLRPGQLPDKNYLTKTRKLLDNYLSEPIERMVFNQKLPQKHLPLILQSSENA